ncbi:MAG: hypothetical protein AB1567_13385, partial [bacterium]
MPEGRMLKKVISTSRKLAELKTDSARLLYTWLIPHLDIEGRFYGDEDIIKGSIVPRIKTFTSEKIKECLQDMVNTGLINWYEVDGDKYLQFTVFEKHQNLNRDREGKSQIPPPPIFSTLGVTPKNSGVTLENSGVTLENSGVTLENSLLSKDKLSKDNINISKDNIFSQIENLLILFSFDIKELILEYIEYAKLENKTKQITDQKKFRL